MPNSSIRPRYPAARPRPSTSVAFVSALLAAAFIRCSGGPPPDEPRPVTTADAGPVVAPPDDGPAFTACPAVPEPTTVTREELTEFLDTTLHAFTARVRVGPVLDSQGAGAHFLGWRIVAIDPALRCGPLGIREGDVVTTVNGLSIQMPDDAQAVWDSLYEATSITVGIIRGGVEDPVTISVSDEPVAITNDGVARPAP